MMPWTTHTKKIWLGLDLGSAAVKAVALDLTARGPRLAALDQEPIAAGCGATPAAAAPDAAAAADGGTGAAVPALQRLLDRMQIVPQRVARLATAIGGPHVTVSEFDMPRMPQRELRRALPWEARKYLPDEERVFDYEVQPPRPDSDRVRVLLASVPPAEMQQHRNLLQAVGLVPERIEAQPIALSLACHGQNGDIAPASRLVLDIGHAGTTLVIGEECGPFFCRFLEIGLGAAALVPAGVADDTDTEAGGPTSALLCEAASGGGGLLEELVLETQRSIAFFTHQNPGAHIQQVVVTGGGAMHADLVRVLGEQLELPVQRFGYKGNNAVPSIEPTHAVSYGLAVRLGR